MELIQDPSHISFFYLILDQFSCVRPLYVFNLLFVVFFFLTVSSNEILQIHAFLLPSGFVEHRHVDYIRTAQERCAARA